MSSIVSTATEDNVSVADGVIWKIKNHTLCSHFDRTDQTSKFSQAASDRQLINIPVILSLDVSFTRTICGIFSNSHISHIRMKVFHGRHFTLRSPQAGVLTARMRNDKRTKADRCDKYNVEWLINLMWVGGNGGKIAAGISWCESAHSKSLIDSVYWNICVPKWLHPKPE